MRITAFEKKYRNVMKNISENNYRFMEKSAAMFGITIPQAITKQYVYVEYSEMSADEWTEMQEALKNHFAKRINVKYGRDKYVPTQKYIKEI